MSGLRVCRGLESGWVVRARQRTARGQGRPDAAIMLPMKAQRTALLGLFLSSVLLSLPAEAMNPDPYAPAANGGIAQLSRLLDRIDRHQRLLLIGAHPDDEDTRLLTVLSQERAAEAAYFSLSRGEGGQNLIGPELGVDLGLIRAQELLAARRIDGSRQFFSRAFDFGYTRSLEETFEFWPHEALLIDAVRVVRRFRPQVIVAVFPGDERAGHGQHQASGVIAEEVFAAAADASRFRELEAEGLLPWRAQRFFRLAWFQRGNPDVELEAGVLDPWTGRSYAQLAMASRSQHRSQDMGMLQELGPQASGLTWVSGGGGPPEHDPFDGLDTSLKALADLLPEGAARQRVSALLADASAAAATVRATLGPSHLAEALEPLYELHASLIEAHEVAQESPVVTSLLDEKIEMSAEALAIASGLSLDTFVESSPLTPGTSFEIETVLYNSGSLGLMATEHLISEGGFSIEAEPQPVTVEGGSVARPKVAARVATGGEPTVPYFLRQRSLGAVVRPDEKALYNWPDRDRAQWGEPFGAPPLRLRFDITLPELGPLPFELTREVVHRYRDQASGEVRRPVRIVPELEVSVEPGLLVVPEKTAFNSPVEVSLRSWSGMPLEGVVSVTAADSLGDWQGPSVPFTVPPSESRHLALDLSLPNPLPPGEHRLLVRARVGDRTYNAAYPTVEYPHIHPVVSPRQAVVRVSAVDYVVPRVSVGYIRGASDRVPEALQAIGVSLELIDPRTLAASKEQALDRFDVVVVGSRAYETDPAVAEIHPRLLDYARRGGVLVVQYQQYQFANNGWSALPLTISRPHGRVTDEQAAVRVLVPGHPVLETPHQIGESDWQGWVQERGLYFAGTWDPGYTPLLEMADEGREPERGSLLVADLGSGHYVYTGLSFFRQLPEGVAGAYRLFLNLLALGE